MVAIVYSTYCWSRVATSNNELIVIARVIGWLWACDVELIEVQPENQYRELKIKINLKSENLTTQIITQRNPDIAPTTLSANERPWNSPLNSIAIYRDSRYVVTLDLSRKHCGEKKSVALSVSSLLLVQ